jgi:hypothetical protein
MNNNLALKYPNTYQEIQTSDDFFDELDMQLDSLFNYVISQDSLILPHPQIVPSNLDIFVDPLFDKIIIK